MTNKTKLTFAKVITTIGVVLAVSYGVSYALMAIWFNMNCGDYLRQAAAANTVEMAKPPLDKAIAYIEKENLTSGYTSIIYRTPSDDIGFWYSNLKASRAELDKLDGNADPLTSSNTLMKLKETITDQGKNGTKLDVPGGIARYPNNSRMAILGMSAIFFSVLGLVMFGKELDRYF